MNNDKALREHLIYLLTDGGAHIQFDDAVKDFPKQHRGIRANGMPHSAWELLEHLRIAQSDILEFSRDAKHVSPEFPKGYWPPSPEPPSDKAWDYSLRAFTRDLSAIVDLVKTGDLFAKISHGDGQSLLREALLTADHNSYHLGQLMLVRKTLASGEPSR